MFLKDVGQHPDYQGVTIVWDDNECPIDFQYSGGTTGDETKSLLTQREKLKDSVDYYPVSTTMTHVGAATTDAADIDLYSHNKVAGLSIFYFMVQ